MGEEGPLYEYELVAPCALAAFKTIDAELDWANPPTDRHNVVLAFVRSLKAVRCDAVVNVEPARRAALTVMWMRSLRPDDNVPAIDGQKSNPFAALPRDAARLIARCVWASRYDFGDWFERFPLLSPSVRMRLVSSLPASSLSLALRAVCPGAAESVKCLSENGNGLSQLSVAALRERPFEPRCPLRGWNAQPQLLRCVSEVFADPFRGLNDPRFYAHGWWCFEALEEQVTIACQLPLEELRGILEDANDCHYMSESLNTIDAFTGERDF